jgi:hypothetical protein
MNYITGLRIMYILFSGINIFAAYVSYDSGQTVWLWANLGCVGWLWYMGLIKKWRT